MCILVSVLALSSPHREIFPSSTENPLEKLAFDSVLIRKFLSLFGLISTATEK